MRSDAPSKDAMRKNAPVAVQTQDRRLLLDTIELKTKA
jgi:hypothetical protein